MVIPQYGRLTLHFNTKLVFGWPGLSSFRSLHSFWKFSHLDLQETPERIHKPLCEIFKAFNFSTTLREGGRGAPNFFIFHVGGKEFPETCTISTNIKLCPGKFRVGPFPVSFLVTVRRKMVYF